MIRKGTYAKYNGKEYRFVDLDDGTVNLVSHNSEENGFIHYDNDIYIKHVNVDTLEETYIINPYAKYKGEIFGVSNAEDGKVLLATSDAELGESFQFNLVDKYFYSKKVDLIEVEIIEDILPYSID
ncbi:hypothetical protein ACFFJY_18005 [Fictibacillus aquaticus]|uniref:Uncharacterized protein n=1 Tax=Fictibacillus aquaticus TaxID=2021314 RepID=A0A235F627_9BACL|nr:hypothetical protein [Fictibacillus aquaticus]OYD56563.1 hypothetical protein CGZ90_16250 [Fictibacillus aquaticus]